MMSKKKEQSMRVGFISRATTVVAFSVFVSSAAALADEPASPVSVANAEPIFGIDASAYETAAGDLATNGPRVPVLTTAGRWHFRQTLARSGQGGGADIGEDSLQITQISYNNAPCNDPKVETPNTLEVLWAETATHFEAEVSVDGELVGAVPGLTQEQIDAGFINGVLLELDAGAHTINVSELDTGTFVEKEFEVIDAAPEFPEIHHLMCLQGISTPDVGPGCEDSCEIRISMTANAGADFYNLILNDIEQPFDLPFGIPVLTLVCAPSGDYTLQMRPHLAARDEDGAIVPGCSYAGCPVDGEGCTLDCAEEPECIAPMNVDVAQNAYPGDGDNAAVFGLWINGVEPEYIGGVNLYIDDGLDPAFNFAQPGGFPPFFGLTGLPPGETTFFLEGVCTDDAPSDLVERFVLAIDDNPHADAVVDNRLVQVFGDGDPAEPNDQTMQLIWENGLPSAYFISLLRRFIDPDPDAVGEVGEVNQIFIIAVAGLNFKFPGDIEGLTFTGPIFQNTFVPDLDAIVTDTFILEFFAYDDETDAMYSSTGVEGTNPIDTDEDTWFDHEDNCPDDANEAQEDFDEDGVGDVCDNCEFDANPDQSDVNENGVGDVCDEGDDGPLFVRGMCSNNGSRLQLSEAVFIFSFLFIGGAAPTCNDACDTNASGVLDLTDGVVTLNFLFTGGPPPANWLDGQPVCEVGTEESCAEGNPGCTDPGPVE